MDVEKKLPFVFNLATGLIATLIVSLVLGEYYYLVFLVLCVMLVTWRVHPRAILAAVLLTLLQSIATSQQIDQTRLVLAILFIAIGEVVFVLIPSIHTGIAVPRSSIGQNMVFALIGITFNLFFRYLWCTYSGFSTSILEITSETFLALRVDSCTQALIFQQANLLTDAQNQFDLLVGIADSMLQVSLRRIFIDPLFWGTIFATLRQMVGDRFGLGRLGVGIPIGCMLSGLLWMLLLIPVSALALIIYLADYVISEFVNTPVNGVSTSEAVSIFASNPVLVQAVSFFFLTLMVLVTALAIALSVKAATAITGIYRTT